MPLWPTVVVKTGLDVTDSPLADVRSKGAVVMREFLRHPSNIPIDVRVVSERVEQVEEHANTRDVSMAGLCCLVDHEIPCGSDVEFRVPLLSEEYVGRGTVVWCRPGREGYQLGIEFSRQDDVFRVKMVEQLCQIEAYRREIRACDGRELDGEQAAREWIKRFADDFNRRFTMAC